MTVTKKMPMSSLTTAVDKLEMKEWQWEGEEEGEDKEHTPSVDPPCALMYEVSTNKTLKGGYNKVQAEATLCQALTTEMHRLWLLLL